jgi:hypothetical protein
MKRSFSHAIRVGILVTSAVASALACGPKAPTTTPRPDPEAETPDPRRGDGPPEKLMPEELKDKVDAVFNAQKADLERCYTEYTANHSVRKLRGKVIIAVKIGYTATPTKVWFITNTFTQEELTRCFLEKIKLWEFPTWGGLMDYSFPPVELEEM